MRCFVALDLPLAVRKQLVKDTLALRRFGDVRWIESEAMHVTLKFLGEVDEAQARAVGELLREPLPALRLSVAGLGRFPARGAIRVVWAGLGGDIDALGELAKRFEQRAAEVSVPEEKRPFRPHVTLGRSRSPRGSGPLGKELEARAEAVRSEPFVPDGVVLHRSELKPGGPVYTELARASFA